MAVTAMAGTVSFGLQSAKGTRATTFFRHRATQVDLSVADDTRLGIPEVGGVPTPTFPYKAGHLITGGLTIQPRLESTVGNILLSVMGRDIINRAVEDIDAILVRTAIIASGYTETGSFPKARFLAGTFEIPADYTVTKEASSIALTAFSDVAGNLTITKASHGLANDTVIAIYGSKYIDGLWLVKAAATNTFEIQSLYGAASLLYNTHTAGEWATEAARYYLPDRVKSVSTETGATITEYIYIPRINGVSVGIGDYSTASAATVTGSNLTFTVVESDGTTPLTIAGGYMSVGYTTAAAYEHNFKFKSDSVDIPWMTFRKHIPRLNGGATTDVGEIFDDCKIVNFNLSLPNDAPISARIDVLGRDFEIDPAPDQWTYSNAFENYLSIPVGCQTAGYISVPSFSATELPVVAATVGFQNVPLDIRQERTFGSSTLDDITIVMRQLTFDILIKWNNPDLYRAILTGSTSGTTWSSQPYTGSLDILINSPSNMSGEVLPYSLRVQAPSIMIALADGINLAGNQSVMMRFTGTALSNESGDYAVFTLCNLNDTAYAE